MDIKNPTAPCICCHATSWNITARKQAISDNLQGSVATYLRCGDVVNNQIKKKLLPRLWVFFLNWWIFGKVTSKSVVVLCTLRNTLQKDEESAPDYHAFACNFAKYSPILKHFSFADSAINLS